MIPFVALGFLNYRFVCETESCSVSPSAAVLISSSPSNGNEGLRMMNLAGKFRSSLFSNIRHFLHHLTQHFLLSLWCLGYHHRGRMIIGWVCWRLMIAHTSSLRNLEEWKTVILTCELQALSSNEAFNEIPWETQGEYTFLQFIPGQFQDMYKSGKLL